METDEIKKKFNEVLEKLDENYDSTSHIEQSIRSIEAFLGIVPDITTEITDIDLSIDNYKRYAHQILKIEDSTIKKHVNVLTNFLYFTGGQVSIETVQAYLKRNESQSWMNQQLKALRRYCRDFLTLGRWIESFEIKNIDTVSIKRSTSDLELAEFYNKLQGYSQLIFLVLHDTGLRLDESINITLEMIDFDTNSIDVSKLHSGKTKFSWYVFITDVTKVLLLLFIKENPEWFEDTTRQLFPISPRGVELEFQKVSNDLELQIKPKDLRSIWVTKMTEANISDRYINAIQGRVSKKVLSQHYTDYSPENLKKQYDKAKQLFLLPLS